MMTNKTIVITGANSGIGKQTALELARMGGKIIMACRNLQSAKIARGDDASILLLKRTNLLFIIILCAAKQNDIIDRNYFL